MSFRPLRPVALPHETESAYDDWLAAIDRELSDPRCDRYEFCRRMLMEIYYPDLIGRDPATLPPSTRIALLQMDARNITLEPEHYHDIDLDRYAPVKPLIWLWEMFDKSPLGENVHLGVKFRRILAQRIFKRCGRNFKAFHFMKLSFGYNLEVGDDVVIHRHVLLDDRGGIAIGNRVSVSDFANIYSHSHDIVDARVVSTANTIIDDDVRITYHATVLAGVHLTVDSMVGAMALVTRDTEPHTVHAGIPAKTIKRKPNVERRPPTPDPLAG